MPRILIVEDEPTLARGLRDAFEHHDFEVLTAADGEAGLAMAVAERPALVILDLMLPKKNGTEVCRDLRRRNLQVPVIMLTAKAEEADRIGGFEVGADDYVTKPFSIRELVARAQAVLRRASAPPAPVPDRVRIGHVTVDFKEYVVVNGQRRVALTPLELSLLRLFLAHPGEVITRERLLNEIWGFQSFPTTRTVDTFMLRLRQKIEPKPRHPVHFLTVYGAGYRFVP
jgi:two-component system alkaline phosphatase synthesis response regulator PhoP